MRRLFYVYGQNYKRQEHERPGDYQQSPGRFFASPQISKELSTMPSNLNLEYYYGNEAEHHDLTQDAAGI